MIQVCLSFVYRNTTDHCVLLLYPATLLRDLSARDIFWWYVYVFFVKSYIMGKSTHILLFFIGICLLFFGCLFALNKISMIIFLEIILFIFVMWYALTFSLFRLKLAVAQLYTVFVMLRCVPLFWTFIMKNIE